ncbi:barstar family protein [Kitasatospora gansuensis]
MGSAMRTAAQDSQGRKYALTSDEDDADFWGFAQEADGLFTPLPEDEGTRRVHLAGCFPQGGLLKSVDLVGTRGAMAGNAWFEMLGADGATMGSYFVGGVTVVDVQPSAYGAGLVDLTVTLSCENALPGAGGIWDLVRTGRMTRTGMWHELDSEGKRAWLSVALWSHQYRRQGKPDVAAGRMFTLNGRHIVDEDSFYCAMGEAVNGPGGYFGWNLDALDDCLTGRWGAAPPFTLRWESSDGARAWLTERVPTRDGEASLFDLIAEIFERRGVCVVLR